MSEATNKHTGILMAGRAIAPLVNENMRLHEVNKALVEALEDIAQGAGPFSMDPLTHAGNCIDYMKVTASAALALSRGETP